LCLLSLLQRTRQRKRNRKAKRRRRRKEKGKGLERGKKKQKQKKRQKKSPFSPLLSGNPAKESNKFEKKKTALAKNNGVLVTEIV
jgi:hypothetical protein